MMAEHLNDLFVQAGFVLFAVAFLVRDVLWLRIVAAVGYLCFIYVNLASDAGPVWSYLGWYGLFVTINVVQAVLLIYRRNWLGLSKDEQVARDLAFGRLDPVSVKRLLRAGRWFSLPRGRVLTVEREVPKRVLLITGGEATVTLGGRRIAKVSAGRFVGEISFLNDGAAGATVVTDADVRCLAWKRGELRRLLGEDQGLYSVMYAAMGNNLAGKISDDNLQILNAQVWANRTVGRG
jgi:hypothetical protein